jgi:Ca2+-binding EF-hand superfamily protein
MKNIIIKTCATWLFAAAPLLHAAAKEDIPIRSTEDVKVVFDALDRNNDSKISRSEATVKGSVSKRFDGIDSDGDGYLSKREFAARPSAEKFE